MIASTRLRPAAVARDALDMVLSFGHDLAEHLLYSALRRRIGLPWAEEYVRDLDRRIHEIEARAAASKAERFPRKEAA